MEEGFVAGNAALAWGISWLTQVPVVGRFFLPSPEDKEGYGKLMAATFRAVDDRCANPTDKLTDMLGSDIKHGIFGEELRSELLNSVTVGSFTPLGAVCGVFLHIITNPRLCALLLREFDNAVHEGLVPPTGVGIITSTKAKKLTYLQATIDEGL
ncbi:hypothetical protein CDD83_8097 [Cordyceps sp. RAO-2017]|nr:hypothetical protein CDD83_8097 [Cordyceps sp. RAO-2017]